MNWVDGLETFITIHKNGSFVKAAETLNLSTPVITKRIQWLEKTLKTTLLKRTTRSVELTEAGEALINRATTLFEEWQNLRETMLLKGAPLVGNMRIATSAEISRHFLMPTISSFAQNNPQLSIQLIEINQPIDLLVEQVDIVIGSDRVIANPDFTRYKVLTKISRQCYAAPQYIKLHGEPRTSKDIKSHKAIGFFSQTFWELNGKTYQINNQFDCSNADMLIELARRGFGLITIPSIFIQEEIKTQQLQHVLPNLKSTPVSLCVYYPKLNYIPQKVDRFLKVLQKYFKSEGSNTDSF